jgi:hypothetical protein
MKGYQFDAYSAAGGVLVGLGIGFGLGYLLARHSFNARLDAEVDSVKAHYNQRAKAFLETGSPFVGTRVGVRPSEQDDLAGEGGNEDDGASAVDDAANAAIAAIDEFYGSKPASDIDPEEGLPNEDGDEDGLEEERDTSRPYALSLAEFAESPDGWQQLTITYYAGDTVLVDDKEQPIQDIVKTVGPLTPLSFGGVSEDPHIRYVRNHRLEVDFEIVLDRRSYVDVVLNYGNPK